MTSMYQLLQVPMVKLNPKYIIQNIDHFSKTIYIVYTNTLGTFEGDKMLGLNEKSVVIWKVNYKMNTSNAK